MRRRLCAVVAGLMVVGAGAVGGAAAADGAGPVATPPSAPQTQTVSGVAVNGVQLSVTAPAQLPLDLPGQQLPEREVDVTVKDAGGQGYSGTVNTTVTSDGAGSSSPALRLDHFDLASGMWETEAIPSGQSSFTVADTVTVPAGGTQVVKLRLSPGTTAADDVKLSVAANGASAVATMPVAGPAFQASGLTAAARAGAPAVLTGKLTNSSDVDFAHVPVKLVLCASGASGCLAHASDVKVEVNSGGAWHQVTVADGTATSPMAATVLSDLTLPAGGTAQFSVRVTVGAGAFGTPGPGQPSGSAGQPASQPSSQVPAQPIALALALAPVGLTLSGPATVAGTLTVQPPPQPTPSATSSTPSTPSSSSTPSATPSSSDATDTPTATPTDTPTPDPASTTEAAASTPGASSSSSNPTILVAAGLLAVCLALVLWWVLMKRRERLAHEAGSEAGFESGLEHDAGDESEHE